ncbi:MAG: LacI family DNA-binding transcriptional regulator [Chloroflexi bacterium]|nr:LacI family DNA-binding transcriptional regulator [Chloroflexota bacterium]
MDAEDQEKSLEAPRERAATIRDVAAAAGVSLSTASYALRGGRKLRPETVDRVKAAAARLEYRPNALMQSLLRGRSYTVGLISREPLARFSLPLLTGVEDALAASHVSVFLCFADRTDAARERQHVESLLAKQVDGIIVLDEQFVDDSPLASRPLDIGNGRTPLLYAYHYVADPDALCLVPDHTQGACLATEHLLASGRRHLAHITGPQHFEAVPLRMKGMRQVMQAHGLTLPDEMVLIGDDWDQRWGRGAVQRLLDAKANIDGIFCGNDTIAVGVVEALHAQGIRVPDDIAVVGFDNWEPFAEYNDPRLTSVDMQIHELGRRAGQAMLAMINGELASGILRLPCRLVLRDSSNAADGNER